MEAKMMDALKVIGKEEIVDETTEEKLWYALLFDREDNDWGIGTFDRDAAIRRLRESDGYYTLIAVIDHDVCVDEITLADLGD